MMRGTDPCPHCGNSRVSMDFNGLTVICENCGCIWQLRLVLISKGSMCHSTDKEFEDEEEEMSPDERILGL